MRLLITDAPLNLANVKSVNVTLSGAQVHLAGQEKTDSESGKEIDDDGKWQYVQEGSKKLDLMQLRNDATDTLGELDLPDGKITQIRLLLDTSKPENNQVVFQDGTSCKLDVTGVDAKGIKINHPFKAIGVGSSERTEVKLDFDASESIDDQRSGKAGSCDIRLKPVIKLKGEPTHGKK